MRIDEIDKNFAVDVKINEKTDIYDAECEPIKLYGGFREGNAFRRVPASVTERVNEGVHALASHTSGMRIRFATDRKIPHRKKQTAKCHSQNETAYFTIGGTV